MKNAITHKNITLVLGILVAIIIVFTLWVRSPEALEVGTSTKIPNVPQAPSVSSVLKSAAVFSIEFLRFRY